MVTRIKNNIDELSKSLNGVIHYKDISYSIIRLLFFKYVVDNFIGASGDFSKVPLYVAARDILGKREVSNSRETISEVLKCVDEYYGCNHSIYNYENIDEYEFVLFGNDLNRQKRTASADRFEYLRYTLFNINLTDNDGKIGELVVNALCNEILESSVRNGKQSGLFTTKSDLIKLVSKLLKVNPADRFCDFVAGVGLSTLTLTEKENEIIHVEIREREASIAMMLYIMAGYEKVRLICEDSLKQIIPEISADKIFVDPPLSMRIETTPENEYSDAALATISRTFNDYLNKNKMDSTAVIAVPSSPLFQSKKQAISLREKIARNVQAVIALPPMWNGTMIGTNLIVLSSEKTNDIVFINAAEDGIKNKKTNDIMLTESMIDKIIDVVDNKKTMAGFSSVISIEHIRENEFNLVPVKYISAVKNNENIKTLEEVDNQLSSLYEQLFKMQFNK